MASDPDPSASKSPNAPDQVSRFRIRQQINEFPQKLGTIRKAVDLGLHTNVNMKEEEFKATLMRMRNDFLRGLKTAPISTYDKLRNFISIRTKVDKYKLTVEEEYKYRFSVIPIGTLTTTLGIGAYLTHSRHGALLKIVTAVTATPILGFAARIEREYGMKRLLFDPKSQLSLDCRRFLQEVDPRHPFLEEFRFIHGYDEGLDDPDNSFRNDDDEDQTSQNFISLTDTSGSPSPPSTVTATRARRANSRQYQYQKDMGGDEEAEPFEPIEVFEKFTPAEALPPLETLQPYEPVTPYQTFEELAPKYPENTSNTKATTSSRVSQRRSSRAHQETINGVDLSALSSYERRKVKIEQHRRRVLSSHENNGVSKSGNTT